MKLPRNLSGTALASSLCKHFNYTQLHQTGSHIILQTENPAHHRIAIPAHKSLRVGTLNSILRSVAKHIGIKRDELLNKLG